MASTTKSALDGDFSPAGPESRMPDEAAQRIKEDADARAESLLLVRATIKRRNSQVSSFLGASGCLSDRVVQALWPPPHSPPPLVYRTTMTPPSSPL